MSHVRRGQYAGTAWFLLRWSLCTRIVSFDYFCEALRPRTCVEPEQEGCELQDKEISTYGEIISHLCTSMRCAIVFQLFGTAVDAFF